MKNGLIFLALTLLTVSCRNESIVENAEIRLVEPREIVSLTPDMTFSCDFSEVLHCLEMKIVKDTILVFQDHPSENSPYHFKAYSTNTFEYMGPFIRNGRGPGEIVFPHIHQDNSNPEYLCISDGRMGYRVDVEASLESGVTSVADSMELPVNRIDWIPISESRYFSLQAEDGQIVMHIAENNGQVEQTFNFDKDISREDNMTHLSGVLLNDRNGGKIAEVMLFFPQINLFDTESGHVRTVAVDYGKNMESATSGIISPDTIEYYENAISDTDYIFAVYKGIPLRRLNETGQNTDIHIFDWEGNFIYDIKVSENIDGMAYDARTGYLYCHEKAKDRIIRYNLSGILD